MHIYVYMSHSPAETRPASPGRDVFFSDSSSVLSIYGQDSPKLRSPGRIDSPLAASVAGTRGEKKKRTSRSRLWLSAGWCCVLQRDAEWLQSVCRVLQYLQCVVMWVRSERWEGKRVESQHVVCVAGCCSVFAACAVCCRVLQCVAVYCSVLQRVAACCSVYASTLSSLQLGLLLLDCLQYS